MSATGYSAWSVTVGEQPTTALWNILGSNDASFNSGQGFNDNIILWRHLSTDIVPTGIILPFGGQTPPSTQWLFCLGQAVSRTTYGTLYGVIGTTFGAGDGVTTFNLPDLRGRNPTGYANGADGNFNAIGQTGGEESHTLSWSEMPVHNHGVNDPGHNHGVTWVGTFNGGYGWVDGSHNQSSGYAYTTWNGSNISIQNAGGGAAHNNLSPYITLNYIIKI